MTQVIINTPDPHSENQRKLMMAFLTPGLEELWIACGTKWGKAVQLSEKIHTTDGLKKFGELQVGDQVFDENGKPTTVEFRTDVMYDHNCYEVVFSDGSTIVADEEHLWVTTTYDERRNIARVKNPKTLNKSTTSKPQIRTTKEILDTLTINVSGKSRPNHAIPLVTKPLDHPKIDLPVPPYQYGVELLKNQSDDKKILPIYFQAAAEDRLALISGLLDVSGTIDNKGYCSFENANKNIIEGLRVLLAMHGVKARITSKVEKHNEVEKIRYRLRFTTDVPVFKLKRKAEKLRDPALKTKQRIIVDIKPVPSVPVMCIRVSNPTHLFLIGETCIPTHNTIGASSAFSVAAPLKRASLWRWVAPIFQQSKIGFNYCRKMLPTEPYCTLNKSQLPTITINQIDSRIEFWHGQNAESLEGEAVMGYIFDEASKMTESVYDSAHTTTTITRGPKVAISTPKGKNWFYRRSMAAKEEMEWALRLGKTPKKIFITAPSTDNPAVTKEAVEQARLTLPDRLFRQYYLAEFVDEGDTFSNYKQCIYGPEIKVQGHRVSWYLHEKVAKVDVVIGADWAKKKDYTVFTAWDVSQKKMIGFMRFTGINYFEAIKQLVYFAKKFSKILMVFHDKTGLGEVIDDLLAKTSLPCEGVVFSTQSKANMVNSLILACEQSIPQLPNWPEMVREMDSYEVTTTESGVMKYAAAEGMHDDIVSSMILGWKGVSEYSDHELTVRTVEALGSDSQLTVADWYKQIMVEDDEDNGWVDLRL